MKLILGAWIISSLMGCSHHVGRVDYEANKLFSQDNAGNRKFSEAGPVTGRAYRFLWQTCDEVATLAVKEMLDEANALGGNAVITVKFLKNGIPVTQPTCQRQWGWLIVAVPFPIISEVQGVAVKLADSGNMSSEAIPVSEGGDTMRLATEYIKRLRNESTVPTVSQK